MAKKKKKYVYRKSEYCIPVTKAEPLNAIQFIIDDFIDKKVSFCIDGEDDQWEIWRKMEENDSDKIKKKGQPENPKILYVDGVKVDNFVIEE